MRTRVTTVLAGALLVTALVGSSVGASAQTRVTALGNGGFGGCFANGGAASVGNVNSGLNSGSDIAIGDTWGEVDVFGGRSSNSTDVTRRANGGLGLCAAGAFGF